MHYSYGSHDTVFPATGMNGITPQVYWKRTMATDWKPGDPIGYIRPEIPDFEMPDYQGERYEAMVPGHLGPSRTSRASSFTL